MSLINDALRRASQAEKDRPRRAPAPLPMEPVVHRHSSRVSVLLAAIVVVALALAGWFFWQWWGARKEGPPAARVAVAPPKTLPPPVVQKPTPAPVAPVVALAQAVPPPTPVVTPPKLPPVVKPIGSPPPVNEDQIAWPDTLKISAIFYNEKNPRVLIGGDIYHVGDLVHGDIVIKKIEKDKVTTAWNGHTKVFRMENE